MQIVAEQKRSVMPSETSSNQIMRDILKMSEDVAETDIPVLIVGEPGTGKEWLARRIHLHSKAAGKKFIEFYCEPLRHHRLEVELFGIESPDNGHGQARPGVMERVGSGTLFFRRISEMPLDLQAKTAQAILTKNYARVDSYSTRLLKARAIATLTRSPLALIREGALSKDIYSSFTAVIFTIPPLRDRREDIPSLVGKFIMECNTLHGTSVSGMTPEALQLLTHYRWPGNVRELRNAVRYATLLAAKDQIQNAHLPPQVREQESHQTEPAKSLVSMAAAEKKLIEQTLTQVVSKKEAARILGISIKTLYNKLMKYSLRDKFVGPPRDSLEH